MRVPFLSEIIGNSIWTICNRVGGLWHCLNPHYPFVPVTALFSLEDNDSKNDRRLTQVDLCASLFCAYKRKTAIHQFSKQLYLRVTTSQSLSLQPPSPSPLHLPPSLQLLTMRFSTALTVFALFTASASASVLHARQSRMSSSTQFLELLCSCTS